MGFRNKILGAAASLTLLGGLGIVTAGGASAGTPSCGPNCVELYTRAFGPAFMTDVFQQKAAVGQETILYRESDTDPALDFVPQEEGTVHDFYEAGLVSASFALHYGGGAGTRVNRSIPNLPAYQLEYAPSGNDTGLCLGTWPGLVPVNHNKVRLEPCGVGANTVWAAYSFDGSGGVPSGNPAGNAADYANFLDAAGTNFSNPYALTYPENGYPTDSPRPWLEVDQLNGTSNDPAPDNQQWSGCIGIIGNDMCAGAGLPTADPVR